MIAVTDQSLFDAAVQELQNYSRGLGRAKRGRIAQVFLGLKHNQPSVPLVGSGQFLPSRILETLLSETFRKPTIGSGQGVLIIFENSYPASGNIWRNHFRYNKGVGCHAPAADLSDPHFLTQRRVQCPYLLPAQPGVLRNARCSLHSASSASRPTPTYRREEHGKWLQISSAGNGYAVVDLTHVPTFLPYVAPRNRRIPILPLLVALYYDAPYLGGRVEIDIPDFAADFHFSTHELNSYFDDDAQNVHNQRLQTAHPQLTTYTPFAASLPPSPASGVATPTSTSVVPSPVLTTVPSVAPAVNTGWEAQEYVRQYLSSRGWAVFPVYTQRVGFDLYAEHQGRRWYIDVKSSVDRCSVTLTQREWEQAQRHGPRYVLAIIDNFVAGGTNIIQWVRNPRGNCTGNQVVTVEYAVPRRSWQQHRVNVSVREQ